MEVKEFGVSVQWGKGMHYFRATDLKTEKDACDLAKAIYKMECRKKSNTKPTVHVWHLAKSITGETK